MQTEINLKKYIQMAKYLDENYKRLGLYETLIFVQNKNYEYSFCRSFGFYDKEKQYLYDFLLEQSIQFIDFKYNADIYNFDKLYECIRTQGLDNLRSYINNMNIVTTIFRDDDILQDLHKLPIVKLFTVKKAYAISIYDIPYIKSIPNIFKPQYIKSLKFTDKYVTFEDKHIYDLDKPLLKDKAKVLKQTIWNQ